MFSEKRLKWLLCCQLFIVVPGLQHERVLPNWSKEFTSYVNATSNTPVKSFKPEKCVVNLTGNVIPNSPDIIIFDWSALSLDTTSVKSSKIVEPFAKAFDEKVGIIFKRTNEKVPVVAAGHSRGFPAILAMLAELKNPKDPKNFI